MMQYTAALRNSAMPIGFAGSIGRSRERSRASVSFYIIARDDAADAWYI
eukprot:SAG31_NODE_595_length_13695_cov_11.446896_10_plen_49_part_00